MTATPGAADAAHVPSQNGRPGQTDQNRLEESLVETLIEDVVEALTDRRGGDHPHPWSPEQRVRIGYLGFTVTPPTPADGVAPDGEGTGADSDNPGPTSVPAVPPRTIDNTSLIGLDFVVALSDGPLTLTCDVGYSLYQQLWPEYSSVQADAAAMLRAAGEHVDAAETTPATVTAQAEDGTTPPAERYEPADDESADGAASRSPIGSDSGRDLVDADGGGDGSVPGGDGDGGGRRRRRGRRPMLRIRPTWRRYDRQVQVTVTIGAGDSDEVIVSSRDLTGGDPLVADTQTAVSDHYNQPEAARKLSGPQTITAREAGSDEATFRAALARRLDANWTPIWPEPELTVIAVPTVDGKLAISVSLVNRTELPERPFQDLALYDAKFEVTIAAGGALEWQRLGFADDDPRYNQIATVPGRGRACVARGDLQLPNRIWTDTLPLFRQVHSKPADVVGADVRFATLAADPVPTLTAIATAMGAFERNWLNPPAYADDPSFFDLLRLQFKNETERFQLGCDLLFGPSADLELARAFRLANAAFARANPSPDARWRLFQLVFIVSQLGGIAARRHPHDARLRQELDAVDVLWFPTGGGKTEAYLGLIATALFFDRLRGKARGTTAQLLFPLRMLSVQQLARMEKVLHHAEAVRGEESIGGDPFTLGYLVGSNNTPNRLMPNARNGWWPGLRRFASWGQDERDRRRLVSACSACGDAAHVGLDADVAAQRLLHVCRSCGHVLAIHASDEEVFRYSSSVIVSTVDKTASFAFNGEYTAFHHGPKYLCPVHGYYTFSKCPVENCPAAHHSTAPPFFDPTPALWIQDELHLVREDLGVFASHYHTLQAELAVGAGNLPSKILAATATIEQYEDQLRQVYGRRPRMFPTGGPTLDGSFYTTVTEDTRRFYLGMLPSGGGTAKVDLAGQLMGLLVRRVHDLTNDPSELITRLAARGITVTVDEALAALFNYELALGYVNSKAHGVHVFDDVQTVSDQLTHAGQDRVLSDYLSGETPIGDLAKVVAAVTSATQTTPSRPERYRALVGTSVVSHGVDLERLNLQVVAGMPPSYASYIQATSRAGRTHVGLVISVFDRFNRRETSVFQSFLTGHEALERMVEPVPVNRFAARAVERTLPGIACCLLWDEAYSDPTAPEEGIMMTRRFKPWWNTVAATLNTTMVDRIRRAYTSPVAGVNPPAAEAKLAVDAETRWDLERQRMQMFGDDWLTNLFTTTAMTSLRDVDAPVEFGGGARAEQVIEHFLGPDVAMPAPAPAP
ncbi:MAG: hypothetical protein JO337_06340 [Acidimicrobiales bacterium]|nr:hypothetical protein [Acidimicrobiales bacterium]